jgi:hypothetical protein
MPASPGEAWCEDCTANLDPGEFVLGVHVSQIDPADLIPDPDPDPL